VEPSLSALPVGEPGQEAHQERKAQGHSARRIHFPCCCVRPAGTCLQGGSVQASRSSPVFHGNSSRSRGRHPRHRRWTNLVICPPLVTISAPARVRPSCSFSYSRRGRMPMGKAGGRAGRGTAARHRGEHPLAAPPRHEAGEGLFYCTFNAPAQSRTIRRDRAGLNDFCRHRRCGDELSPLDLIFTTFVYTIKSMGEASGKQHEQDRRPD